LGRFAGQSSALYVQANTSKGKEKGHSTRVPDVNSVDETENDNQHTDGNIETSASMIARLKERHQKGFAQTFFGKEKGCVTRGEKQGTYKKKLTETEVEDPRRLGELA